MGATHRDKKAHSKHGLAADQSASSQFSQGSTTLSANLGKMIDMINTLVQKSQSTLSIVVQQKQTAVMNQEDTPPYLE